MRMLRRDENILLRIGPKSNIRAGLFSAIEMVSMKNLEDWNTGRSFHSSIIALNLRG
jgi:hypothetical protein